MTVRANDVEYRNLQGYVAIPDDARAALLFLPSVGGLDTFSRERTRELAESGFAALVWHPYSGQAPVRNLQAALTRSQQLSDAKSLAEMSTWLDYIGAELGITKIGVIGFCMGGRFSLLLSARDRRIAACAAIYPSVYSPRLANQREDALSTSALIRCPVAMIYPGRDHVMNAATFQSLRASLEGRDVPTMVQYYPEANHAFMNHTGVANEFASQMAWLQIVAFLRGALLPVKIGVGTAPGL